MSDGRFQPGTTGNPGGRRKDPEQFEMFRSTCREHVDEAVACLVKRIRTQDCVVSAKTIIEYAWGKAPQPMTGAGGDGPAQIEIIRRILDPANPDTPSV